MLTLKVIPREPPIFGRVPEIGNVYLTQGGSYYLVYNVTDQDAEAIKFDRDGNFKGCTAKYRHSYWKRREYLGKTKEFPNIQIEIDWIHDAP